MADSSFPNHRPEPDFTQEDGQRAAEETAKAGRQDRPFSGAEELASRTKPAEPALKAGEAFQRLLETDPQTRAGWQRVRARLQIFSALMQRATGSPEFKVAQAAERQRWQDLEDALREAIHAPGNELAARHFERPETIEDWEHLARIVEMPAESICAGSLTVGEIFACARAWADRQTVKAKLIAEATNQGRQAADDDHAPHGVKSAAGTAYPTPTPPVRAKRSTEKGEGRVKLIAALTKHHQYSDGGCLNLEPVGTAQLARLAGVAKSTTSGFFAQEFGGHATYRAACGDKSQLIASLRLLNQEFSPHHLFGGTPPGERDRDDEE